MDRLFNNVHTGTIVVIAADGKRQENQQYTADQYTKILVFQIFLKCFSDDLHGHTEKDAEYGSSDRENDHPDPGCQ